MCRFVGKDLHCCDIKFVNFDVFYYKIVHVFPFRLTNTQTDTVGSVIPGAGSVGAGFALCPVIVTVVTVAGTQFTARTVAWAAIETGATRCWTSKLKCSQEFRVVRWT